jgi:pimeloyl-ACP methyl ester carboxylesterase
VNPRRVVLVHGIWNMRVWLQPLASRLRVAGFEPEIFPYASVFGASEPAVNRLREWLAREPCGVVGHSLGGLIALEALRAQPELPVTRVVCLGSPLHGSGTAKAMAARGWSAPILGRNAPLLQRGLTRWDGAAQVGMIAGCVPRGLGRLFTKMDGESDGTVTVAETRLPGLADHCIVAASHSGLVFSPAAAAQAAHFLEHGRFGH